MCGGRATSNRCCQGRNGPEGKHALPRAFRHKARGCRTACADGQQGDHTQSPALRFGWCLWRPRTSLYNCLLSHRQQRPGIHGLLSWKWLLDRKTFQEGPRWCRTKTSQAYVKGGAGAKQRLPGFHIAWLARHREGHPLASGVGYSPCRISPGPACKIKPVWRACLDCKAPQGAQEAGRSHKEPAQGFGPHWLWQRKSAGRIFGKVCSAGWWRSKGCNCLCAWTAVSWDELCDRQPAHLWWCALRREFPWGTSCPGLRPPLYVVYRSWVDVRKAHIQAHQFPPIRPSVVPHRQPRALIRLHDPTIHCGFACFCVQGILTPGLCRFYSHLRGPGGPCLYGPDLCMETLEDCGQPVMDCEYWTAYSPSGPRNETFFAWVVH